jgi:hypothetical protein
MGKWINRPKDYWKNWYWNKEGREKVQHSRKVTQLLRWNNNQQKEDETNRK